MKVAPGRALAALAAILLILAVSAASASAFSITSVTSAPDGSNGTLPASGATAAGAHPNLVTTINFNSDSPGTDSVRSVQIHLAPGMVAYVNHIPSCASFDTTTTTATTGCDASVVGSTSTTAATAIGNISLPGTIYRIDPPAGSAAAFGLDITGVGADVKLIATISVDPSDLGLVATLDGLPNTATVPLLGSIPIHINSITQTLNGYDPAGDASFFTNPTSCVAATTGISATSYAGVTTSGSDSYTPTDCQNEPFSSQLAISADPSTFDSTSAVSVDVRPDTTTDVPRVSSQVKNTTVVLPPGVLINSALAARLDACTDAGFNQADTSVAANCPPSSSVGTINFVSPILGSFPGTAYFGTSTPTDLLRLFLDVPLFGAHIKISAHIRPDPVTGQVTTIFDSLPQIAFSDFQLTFRGGPQSALVTPTTCGVNTASAILGPYSGGADSTPSGSFTTTGDNGAPCARTFSPSVAAAVSTTRSGASPTFTLTANRPDRTVPFKDLKVSLPPGLIGRIALPGLTQCSLAQAAAATCPASSEVGTVASVVGSGSQPPTLPGTVYLAAPKVAGDPASLAIVVPAKLGPVDAGTIVVGARLTLRSDGGLDVTSDPIPALQRGIPLAIQQLAITLDKPGFMQNPSSCGPQTISSVFDPLDGGPAAAASTSLSFTDCGSLAFAPQISASIKGTGLTKAGTHPALTTVISQKVGEGTIKTARVTLPSSLSTNTAAVLAGCSTTDYAANRCPKTSIVATASANSPLVSQPLAGPVYIVTSPGRLPTLKVQLRGPVAVDLTGSISFAKGAGGLITTFNDIPDLALTRFQLAFHNGKLGVIAVVNSVCSPTPKIAATFTGHNGRVTSQSHTIAVTGCPPVPKRTASLRFRASSGTLTVKVTRAKKEKALAAVSVALPKTLKLTKGAIAVKANGKRLKAKAIKVKGATVTVSLGAKGVGATTVTLSKVRASTKALARKLAKKKGKLAVTVGTRDTGKARTKAKVTLKLT